MEQRRLLLADDSITIQKVVNLTFADEGIEVISVGDGDSAMEKFRELKPDLVMADVNMPGLNGYEICEIIKQSDETKQIPVILLVGSFEPFDEAEASRVGANDFLTKPFQSIRQLVNKVTDLLNAGETAATDVEVQSGEETAPPKDAFADTLDMENEENARAEFGDTGMDDEMIESSRVDDYASRSIPSYEDEAAKLEDYAKTQPLNAEDLKQFDFTGSGDADERQASADEELSQETATADEEPQEAITEEETAIEEQSAEEETSSTPEPSYITGYEKSYYSREPQSENQFSEQEFAEPEASTEDEADLTGEAKTLDLTEDLRETSFADESEREEFREPQTSFADESEKEETEELEADSMEKSETGDLKESETAVTGEAETRVSAPETAPALDLDDDLLELPPLVEETGIRPQPPAQEVKTEPETVAEAQTETAETQPSAETAVPQSFPPELIEAIAQKVAEKISDKAIRDIAWEVVPQMTELIIRKMAEENVEKKMAEEKPEE